MSPLSNTENARKTREADARAAWAGASGAWPPVTITRPAGLSLPLIVSSPHSGRNYTPEFLARSRLSLDILRSGEDFHVDTLVSSAPQYGATLLCATFPRVVCDVNRASLDMDPAMIEAGEEAGLMPTERGRVGLGSVPTIVSGGRRVYRDKLSLDETTSRLRRFWHPYHGALGRLIEDMRAVHGFCVVLDMHSMPPGVEGSKADFVIGDRFGESSEAGFVSLLSRALVEEGFRVARNHPFAGGFITSHYGRPQDGVNVIQLEINRALYMWPRPGHGFGLNPRFAPQMERVIAWMAGGVARHQTAG